MLCAGFALVSAGCSSPQTGTGAEEKPASRGQRNPILSELHGSRKLLSDALAANPATTQAGAVEALIRMETELLTAMKGAVLSPDPHPLEREGLAREELQQLGRETEEASRSAIDGCLEKLSGGALATPEGVTPRSATELGEAFRSERDATLAFVRESEFSFYRRTIEHPQCGSMNLATAFMLQAELSTKVAENVRANGN